MKIAQIAAMTVVLGALTGGPALAELQSHTPTDGFSSNFSSSMRAPNKNSSRFTEEESSRTTASDLAAADRGFVPAGNCIDAVANPDRNTDLAAYCGPSGQRGWAPAIAPIEPVYPNNAPVGR